MEEHVVSVEQELGKAVDLTCCVMGPGRVFFNVRKASF
jgi:hypothetical protein